MKDAKVLEKRVYKDQINQNSFDLSKLNVNDHFQTDLNLMIIKAEKRVMLKCQII